MIIKVCGMRQAENIRTAEALGADWIGMIFWARSSRCVTAPPAYLPQQARRVGVFVDETVEKVRELANAYRLDIIQLHGKEPPEYAVQLKERTIVKAISIATAEDLEQTKPYEGIADYFLFDTKGESRGGNGRQFDWSLLSGYHGTTPFLLSGGIGPDDAARIRAFHHPAYAGIDINSRFEIQPGLKDINLLKDFIRKIRL